MQQILSDALLLAGSPQSIFDQIVRWVSDFFQVEIATIELLEGDRIKIVSCRMDGTMMNEVEFPLAGTPCEEVRKHRKHCIFKQVSRLFPDDEFLRQHQISLYVGVPIVDSSGEVIGVINAMGRKERDVTDEEFELLNLMAKRVALELRHQQEIEESYRLRHKLLEIGHEIIHHVKTEEILLSVAHGIRAHSPFKLVAISLYESPVDPAKESREMIGRTVIAGLSAAEEQKLQNVAKTGGFIPARLILKNGRPIGGGYYVDPQMVPEIVPTSVKGKMASPDPGGWGEYDDFFFFLWHGSEIIGRISLGDPSHGRIPQASELEPLNLFATLAALALVKARQLEELSEFQRRLHGIYEWSTRLSSLDEINVLIDEALRILTENFRYDHISLFIADGKDLKLSGFTSRLPIEQFAKESFTTLAFTEGIVGRVARERQPALVGDVREDPDYVMDHPDIRSELAVPIVTEGELLGVLNIESTELDAFDQDDLELLSAQSRQLGFSMRDLHRRNELKWLNTFLHRLNEARDPKEIFEIMIQRGMDMVSPKADGGVFLILDEEKKVFYYAAAINRDLERLQQTTYGEDEVRAVFQSLDKPIITSLSSFRDLHDIARFENEGQMVFPASAISLPIQMDGKLIAVCNITNQDREGVFNEQDAKNLWKLVAESELALARAHHHARLKEMAMHDALTNTYNRHYFNQYIEQERARAAKLGSPISLVMVDVDNFYQVNDRYGHSQGDRILQLVAGLIGKVVRKPDTVVRYGGDEFVIIMPSTRLEDAERVMERLRIRFEEWKPDLPDLKLSISFGVASWDPAGHETLDAVLEKADQFLYHRRQSRPQDKRANRQATIGATEKETGP